MSDLILIKEKFLKSLKEHKVRGFVITLYIVGIIGTALPFTRGFFIFLTPFVLLLSFAILLIFQSSGFDTKTILIFLIIYLISFLVEVAGVKTGIIFGSYSYGTGLGIKIFETPLMIGLNWIFLLYCTSSILEKIRTNDLIKISGASVMMLAYDVVMEQVAPHLDMWTFEGGTVPLRNYVSWFLLALIFHSLLKLAGVRTVNKFGPLLFFCQGLFFAVLFIFFKLTE